MAAEFRISNITGDQGGLRSSFSTAFLFCLASSLSSSRIDCGDIGPSLANRTAMLRPIPLSPPVIMASFRSSFWSRDDTEHHRAARDQAAIPCPACPDGAWERQLRIAARARLHGLAFLRRLFRLRLVASIFAWVRRCCAAVLDLPIKAPIRERGSPAKKRAPNRNRAPSRGDEPQEAPPRSGSSRGADKEDHRI